MDGLLRYVKRTTNAEDDVWTDTHINRRLGNDEMIEKINAMFEKLKEKWSDPEKKADEVGTPPIASGGGGESGWNAVHNIASGLDSAFGLGSERKSTPPKPVSSGPDSDLVWLSM